jgi:hypothetical protein
VSLKNSDIIASMPGIDEREEEKSISFFVVGGMGMEGRV